MSKLQEVENILKQWQANVTEPMIAKRRQVGVSTTMGNIVNEVGQAKGKQYFDKFRGLMQEFSDIEKSLMEVRQADKVETLVMTEWVVALGTILIVLIGGLFGIYIVRDLMRSLGGEPYEVRQIANSIASGNLAIHLTRAVKKRVFTALCLTSLNNLSL